MDNRLVSIVIPVYNVAQFLPDCLDSVLAQTHRSIEVILVDDGSIDNSGAICNDYASRDCRVKVLHKINGGATAARRDGVAEAGGELVMFVDADDTIEPDMVEKAIALAIDKSDIVSMEEADNLICDAVGYCSRLLHWNAVHLWGKLFRRDLLLHPDIFDTPRDFTIAEDLLTNLKIVKYITRYVVISSIHKYNYRFVQGSLAHSAKITPEYDWKVLQEVTKMVDATPLDLRQAFVDFRISILRHLICGRYKFDRQWAEELKKDSGEWPLDPMQRRVINAIDRPAQRPVIRAIVIARKIKGKLSKL